MTTIFHEEEIRNKIKAEETQSWLIIQNRMIKTMQSIYKQFDLKTTRLRTNRKALEKSLQVDKELDLHLSSVMHTELHQQVDRMREASRRHTINDKIVHDHKSETLRKKLELLMNDEEHHRQGVRIGEAEDFQVYCIAFVGGRGGLSAIRRQQLRMKTVEEYFVGHEDDENDEQSHQRRRRINDMMMMNDDQDDDNDDGVFQQQQITTSTKRPPPPSSAHLNRTFSSMMNNNDHNSHQQQRNNNSMTPPPSASSGPFSSSVRKNQKSPAAGSGVNLLRRNKETRNNNNNNNNNNQQQAKKTQGIVYTANDVALKALQQKVRSLSRTPQKNNNKLDDLVESTERQLRNVRFDDDDDDDENKDDIDNNNTNNKELLGDNNNQQQQQHPALIDFGTHRLNPEERLLIFKSNPFFYQNQEVERSLHADLRTYRQEHQRQINKQRKQNEHDAAERERLDYEHAVQEKQSEVKRIEARKKTIMTAALARAYSSKSKALLRQQIKDEMALLTNTNNNALYHHFHTPGSFPSPPPHQAGEDVGGQNDDDGMEGSLLLSEADENEMVLSNNNSMVISNNTSPAPDSVSNPSKLLLMNFSPIVPSTRSQERQSSKNSNSNSNKRNQLRSPHSAVLDDDDALLARTGDANFIMSQSLNPMSPNSFAGNKNKNNKHNTTDLFSDDDDDEGDINGSPMLSSAKAKKKHRHNIISRNKKNISGKGNNSNSNNTTTRSSATSGKYDNIVTIRGEALGRSLAEFHQERRDMLESIACVDIEKLNEFEKSRNEFALSWLESRHAMNLVAVSAIEPPFLHPPPAPASDQAQLQMMTSSSSSSSHFHQQQQSSSSSPAAALNTSSTALSATSSSSHHHHQKKTKSLNNSSRDHGGSSNNTRIVAELAVSISKCPVLTHTMKDRLRSAVTVNYGDLYRGYPFEGPITVDDDYVEPVQDMLGRRNAKKKKQKQQQQHQQLQLSKSGHSGNQSGVFLPQNSSSPTQNNNNNQERVSLLSRRRASIVADVDDDDDDNNDQVQDNKNNNESSQQSKRSNNSSLKKQQSFKSDVSSSFTDEDINDEDNPQPLARAIRFTSRALQLRKHINCLDLRSIKHPLNEIAMTEVICLLALCPQVIRVLWPKEAPPVKQTTVESALRLLKENTGYLQRVFALCDVKNALFKLPSIEEAEADTLPMVRKIAHFTWELLRDFFDLGQKMLRQHVILVQKEGFASIHVELAASLKQVDVRVKRRLEHEQAQRDFADDDIKRREAIIGIEDRARRVIYRVAYDESTEIELRDQLRERTHHDERKKLDKERFEDMNSIRKEELKEYHGLLDISQKKMRLLEKKEQDRIRQLEMIAEAEAREEKLKQMEEARQRREEQMAEINRQSMLRTAATQRQIFESDERRARDRITGAEKKLLDNVLTPMSVDIRDLQHAWDRHCERLRGLTAMRNTPLRCTFFIPQPEEEDIVPQNGGDDDQQQKSINDINIKNKNNTNTIAITAPLKRNHSVLKGLLSSPTATVNSPTSPTNDQQQHSFVGNNASALTISSNNNNTLLSDLSTSTLSSLKYDAVVPRHYILETKLPLNLISVHSSSQRLLPHQKLVRSLGISVECPTPIYSWHATPETKVSRAKHIDRARTLILKEAAQRGVRRLPSLAASLATTSSDQNSGGGGNSSSNNNNKPSGAGKKSSGSNENDDNSASNAPVTKAGSKKEQELIQQEIMVQNAVMDSFDKEGEEIITAWKKTKENVTNIEVSFATPQDSLFACCWSDPSCIAPRWQAKPEPKSKQTTRPTSAANKNVLSGRGENNKNSSEDDDDAPFDEEGMLVDDSFAAELEMLEASINPAPVAIDYIDAETGFVHFLLFDCHGDFYGNHDDTTKSDQVRPPLKSSHSHCNRVVASMIMEPLFAPNFFEFDRADDDEVKEDKRSRYLEFLETMIDQPTFVPSLSHFGRKFTIQCPPRFSQTYENGAETADDVSLHSDLEGKVFTLEETAKILKWATERIGVFKMKAPQPDVLAAVDRKRNLRKSPSHQLMMMENNNNNNEQQGSLSSLPQSPTSNNNINSNASGSFAGQQQQGGDLENSPSIKFLDEDAEMKYKNIFSSSSDENHHNGNNSNFGALLIQLQSTPAPFVAQDEPDPVSEILGRNEKTFRQRSVTENDMCPILSVMIGEQQREKTDDKKASSSISATSRRTSVVAPYVNDNDQQNHDDKDNHATPSFLSIITAAARETEEVRRIEVDRIEEERRQRERRKREEQERAHGRHRDTFRITSCAKTKFEFETSSLLGQMYRKDAEMEEIFDPISIRFREGNDPVLLFPNASVPMPFFARLKEKGGGTGPLASIAMLSSTGSEHNITTLVSSPSFSTATFTPPASSTELAVSGGSSANNNNSSSSPTTVQVPTVSVAIVLEVFATRSAFFDPADCIWFIPADHSKAGERRNAGKFTTGKNAFGQKQILRNGRPILYWIEGDILKDEGESIEFNQEENIWPPIEDAVHRVVLRLMPDASPEHIEDFLRSLVYKNESKNIVVGKRHITASVVLYNAINSHFQDRVAQDADAVARQVSFLSVIETEAIDDPTDIFFNWPATSNNKKCIMSLPQPNQIIPQPAPPFLVCFNATVDDPDTPQFENFALAGSLLHLLPTGQPSPYRLNATTKYDKAAQTFKYELSLATLEEMKKWRPLDNEAAPGSLEPSVIFNHRPSLSTSPDDIVSVNINNKAKSTGSRTPAISRKNSMVASAMTSKQNTPSKITTNKKPINNNSTSNDLMNHQHPQHHDSSTNTSARGSDKNSRASDNNDENNNNNNDSKNDLIDLLDLRRDTNELYIGDKMSGTFTFDQDNLSFRYDIIDCTLEELDMIVKRLCIRAFPVLHPKTEGGPREALKKPPPARADEIVNIQRLKQKLPGSHFLNHSYVLSSAHNAYRINPMFLQLHLRLIPPKNLPRTPPTLVHHNIQVLPPLVVPSANSMIHKYREDSGKRPLALFEVGPGEKVVNNIVSLSESDGWEQGCVMFRLTENACAEDFLSFEQDKDTKIIKVSDLLDDVALIGGIKGLTVPSNAELKKKREQEALLLKQEREKAAAAAAAASGPATPTAVTTRPTSGTANDSGKPGGESSPSPSSSKPKITSKPSSATPARKEKDSTPEPAPKKAPTASELSRAKTSGAILVSACKNPGWRHVVKTAHQYESYFVTTGVRHDIFALVERITQHQLVITFRSTTGDFNSFVRRNDVANILRKVHYEHTSDNPDVDAPKIVEVCSTTNNFVHISRSYVTILIQGVDDATELFRASVPREMHDKQQLYPRVIRSEGAEDRRGFCPLDDLELDDPDTPCFNDFIITIQMSNLSGSTVSKLAEKIDFLNVAAQRVLNDHPNNSASTSARTDQNNKNDMLDDDENRARVVYALRQVTPTPQFKPDGSRVLCLTANNHPIAMAYLSPPSTITNTTSLMIVSFKLDEDKYGEIRSHEVATTRWNDDIMNTEVYKFEETYPIVEPEGPTREEIEEKEKQDKAAAAAKKGGKAGAGGKAAPKKGGPAAKKAAPKPPAGTKKGGDSSSKTDNNNNDNNNNDDEDGESGGAATRSKAKIAIAQNLGLLIPMSALQDLLRRIVISVDPVRIPADGAMKQVACKIKSREGAEGKIAFPVEYLPPCFHCPPGSVESELVLPKSNALLIVGDDHDNENENDENSDHQNKTTTGKDNKFEEMNKDPDFDLLKRVSSAYSPLFGRACSVLLQPAELIATMRRNAMLKDEASFVHFQCILNPRVVGATKKKDSSSSSDHHSHHHHRVTLQLHPALLSHSTIQLQILPFEGDDNRKKFSHKIVELNTNNSGNDPETLFYVSQSFNKQDESSQLRIFAADEKYSSSAKLSDLLKCITVVRTEVAATDDNNNNKKSDDKTKREIDFDEVDDKMMQVLQQQQLFSDHDLAANLNPSFFMVSSPSVLAPSNTLLASSASCTLNATSTVSLLKKSGTAMFAPQQEKEQPRPEQNLYFCHCKLVTFEDDDLAIKSFIVHA